MTSMSEVARQLETIQRGLVDLHVADELKKKLERSVATGKPLRVKAGFDPSAKYLRNVSGTLYFTANDGASGNELWKSDGTDSGTRLVTDIQPGSGERYRTTYSAVELLALGYLAEEPEVSGER